MSFSSPANTVTHSANARFVLTDRRPAFVAIRDQIKEQLAAGPFERDESHFVHDEDVDAEQSLLETRELARIPRFQELAHQIGRTGEEHASFLLRGFNTQGNGQMRPSRSRSDRRR